MTLESNDTIPDEINEVMTTQITLYMVQSSIGDTVYGPFISCSDALAFAEPADGSVFECAMRPIDIKRVW
jgi:hypothetical protein